MESQSYSSSSSTSTLLPSARRPRIPGPQFHSALHLVRRIPAKPWKKPVAPLPPTPQRIYKVAAVDFKQVVQKLTGAPAAECQYSRRLQAMAPSPLSIAKAAPATSGGLPWPKTTAAPWKLPETSVPAESPLGLSLSPLSSSWFSFPMLSPGTLSSVSTFM
ncbi:uncharacterized protein LOC127810213 [Diospyros lotus]|uniref:uncharacterized protein LOC127810213 n=1 Tax=Diospyros lotus TaxID=55363 RepID=UPI0022523560|nr:uncharacterized protein LOC127810213 [Diospyros lotus]